MKIIKRSITLLGLLFAVHVNTQAQQIDDNSITNLVLKDGTTVVLYQGLPAELKSLANELSASYSLEPIFIEEKLFGWLFQCRK